MGRVTGRSFWFCLAMEQIGSQGTIDRAGGRDGVRGIKQDAYGTSHVEFGPSCQFKAASYLLWEYSEACLHLELCYLLEGEVAVGAVCPLSRVVAPSC